MHGGHGEPGRLGDHLYQYGPCAVVATLESSRILTMMMLVLVLARACVRVCVCVIKQHAVRARLARRKRAPAPVRCSGRSTHGGLAFTHASSLLHANSVLCRLLPAQPGPDRLPRFVHNAVLPLSRLPTRVSNTHASLA
jgi:hypothetical protein